MVGAGVRNEGRRRTMQCVVPSWSYVRTLSNKPASAWNAPWSRSIMHAFHYCVPLDTASPVSIHHFHPSYRSLSYADRSDPIRP